jgi:GH25 family lysozyme M1 (1,4-beta-N-acetylmuramidase)
MRPSRLALAPLVLALIATTFSDAASAGSRHDGTASAGGRPAARATTMAQPPNTLPGIDVSHWQNEIDWTQVAASGVRFVIMKATEGRTFTDPNYASNRAGAAAAGLTITAYHFANPGTAAVDPIIEADHFVDVAQIGSGNVIPVLDLERTQGLTTAKLVAWAFAWLEEVTARTGVKPMIYSGPYFWRTYMGNTTAFADAGYREWIAHWGVSSPAVPAENWGGQGWTFWQWTDCSAVPGISGCVDADWFNGTDLGTVTIRQLTVSLNALDGVVTSTPSRIDCGSACSSLFDPGAVVTLVATPDPGAVFVGWSGSCAGTGACVVTMDADRSVLATFGFTLSASVAGPGTGRITSAPSGIDCGSACSAAFATGTTVTLTATPNPGMEFAGWSGDCAGRGTCVVTMDAAHTVSAKFVDDTPPSVTITTPSTLTGAITATFSEIVHQVTSQNVVLRAGGSSANAKAALTCASRKGLTVDCATGDVVTAMLQPRAALIAGQDYSVIVDPAGVPSIVDRGGNAAPTTSSDFAAASQVEQDNPALTYRWRSVPNRAAYGGSYFVEHLARARISFAFTGGSVTWYTVTGPTQGRASVSIDGRFRGTFDQSSRNTRFRVARRFTGLGAGAHKITIIVLGKRGRASTDTQVTVDAFRAGGSLHATPAVVAAWHPVGAPEASNSSFAETDLAGSSVWLRFRGTAIDWYTVKGPNKGRARVYVDGRLVRTVDNHSAQATFEVRRHVGGLTDAVHFIRILVLGESRRAATGSMVAIDRFVVQ